MEELLFDRGLMTNVLKIIEKTKNTRIPKSLSGKNYKNSLFTTISLVLLTLSRLREEDFKHF